MQCGCTRVLEITAHEPPSRTEPAKHCQTHLKPQRASVRIPRLRLRITPVTEEMVKAANHAAMNLGLGFIGCRV